MTDEKQKPIPVSSRALIWTILGIGGGVGALGTVQVTQTVSVEDQLRNMSERMVSFDTTQKAVVRTLEKIDSRLANLGDGINGHGQQLVDHEARIRALEEWRKEQRDK